jgi:hypothetical protein
MSYELIVLLLLPQLEAQKNKLEVENRKLKYRVTHLARNLDAELKKNQK